MRRPTLSLPTADGADGLYRAAWRWHFYAGLFVAPVLLVLALSGLVMLLRGPLDAVLYGNLTSVVPGVTAPRPPSEQIAAVRAAFPHAEPVLFVPPRTPTRATEIAVEPAGAHGAAGHGHDAAPTISVFVDPFTARVLGSIDPGSTPYAWANSIHGSLLLGVFGDGLVEIAAGLAVLLIGSGVFLAWPRGVRWRAALVPKPSIGRRADSRALHGALGFWLAIPLLFFLLSGLTWTGVWGARLLQAWNTVAVDRSPGTEVAHTHGDLNRAPLEEVPWPLEQARLPVSGPAAEASRAHGSPDLDGVVQLARAMGFEHFRINLPRGHDGVWTVSASTMADDVDDPRAERFVHIDRHTGRVLADIGFDDYSPVAQFMAAGVPFHQGDLGRWNVAFNALVCLTVVALVSLAAVLWWQRRPGLAGFAPPRPDPRAWRWMVALMLAFALVFPLTAAAIAMVVGFDLLVVSRYAARQRLA